MFRFAHPEWLYGLLAIPALWILFAVAERIKRKRLQKIGEKGLVMRLAEGYSSLFTNIRSALFLTAVVLAFLGAANPQIGTRLEEVKREGIDIFIAIDVSNSMKAEDIKPNRLERARQAISKMIDKLGSNRIGMVVFAGEAFVQLPITTDFAAAKLFLSAIDTDVVPVQGTAIGSALETVMQSFGNKSKKHKAVIVITDGENHEDNAVEIAKKAAEQGIVIHAIGMGSPAGGPIPIYKNGVPSGFKKDREGNTVISKLNEEALQQIAASGNGKFVRATSSDVGLEQILDDINKMEKTEFGSKMFTDYEDRYQWLLLPAFILLAVEFLFPLRRKITPHA